MTLPDWLMDVLHAYDTRTEPMMEVEIGQAIQSARPPVNLNDADWSAFLAEHSAFMFHDRHAGNSPWGTFFAPMFEGTREDGSKHEMPNVLLLTGETVAHWAKRVETVRNPIMRARYADCVWDLEQLITKSTRPRHQFARIAATSYIEATVAKMYSQVFSGVEWLSRALSLARSVNDQSLTAHVVQALLELSSNSAKPEDIGIWIAPFDHLYGERGLLTDAQRTKIIDDLEKMLSITTDPNGGHFDPFGARAAAERLISHYKDNTERQRLTLAYGTAFEHMSKDADPMLAMAWLQPVIESYEQVGLKADAERLALYAAEKGAETSKNLKTVSAEMKISGEDLEDIANRIMGDGELEGALHRLGAFFLPDPSAARDMLMRAKRDAPFQALIQIVITRADGQPEAIIGSTDDDLEGRLQKQISDIALMSKGLLIYMLGMTLERTKATADDICDVLYRSPVFIERRRELIRQGIAAHMDGDYVTAVHLLVPQVEEMLRNVLGLIGVPVYKTVRSKPGVTDVKNMNEVLQDPRLEAVLSEHLRRYLTVLYVDRRGINLRNHIAHGLMSVEAFNVAISSLVLHSLICLSRLRTR